MPTTADFEELASNCTSEFTFVNGIAGRKFTSSINGNSVFFPLAGFYSGTVRSYNGENGYYWSNTWLSETKAYYMQVTRSTVHATYTSDRQFGFLIRPVLPGTPNRSIIPPTPEDEPKDEETPATEEPKDDNER